MIKVGDTVEYLGTNGKLYKAKVISVISPNKFHLNVFEGTRRPSYISQETWVLSPPYPRIKTKFLEGFQL